MLRNVQIILFWLGLFFGFIFPNLVSLYVYIKEKRYIVFGMLTKKNRLGLDPALLKLELLCVRFQYLSVALAVIFLAVYFYDFWLV